MMTRRDVMKRAAQFGTPGRLPIPDSPANLEARCRAFVRINDEIHQGTWVWGAG